MASIQPQENPFAAPLTELWSSRRIRKGNYLSGIAINQLTALIESLTKAQNFFISLENYSVKPFDLEQEFSQLTAHLHNAQKQALNLILDCKKLIAFFNSVAVNLSFILDTIRQHQKELAAQPFVDELKLKKELALLQSFLRSVKTGELRGDLNLLKIAIAYEYKLIPLRYELRSLKKRVNNFSPRLNELKPV